jgi:hypothetical protein
VLLTLAALAACAPVPKSKVLEDAGEFSRHRAVGIAPFIDTRGQGQTIADTIQAGLQALMYEPVDQKALAQIVAATMPNRSAAPGIEALERIHSKTGVDAIIFGRMAPDWSTALITVDEIEMGSPILRAVLRPSDPKKKAFTDADDVAKEALRVLTSLH